LSDDLESLLDRFKGQRIGAMVFQQPLAELPESQQFVLSPTGDLEEAARHLYDALHHLDALGLDVLLAETLPERGIGIAMNDRLRRAAAK
jgi:L-threonylcarbamoyladenylate synthase